VFLSILAEVGLEGKLTAEQRKALNIGEDFKNIEEFLIDEMISDLGGTQWTDADFWSDVFGRIEAEHGTEKAKGIIQKMVSALKLMLSQFQKILSGNFADFKTQQDLAKNVTPEKLDAIKRAISIAYADWISEEKSAEQRKLLDTLGLRQASVT
jgi:hypothetical protein